MIIHDEDARAKNVAPKLEHATLTYGQDPDSNAPTGTILNRLAVQVTDAGGGRTPLTRQEEIAHWVQEVEWRETSLGAALYIRIQRYDEQSMSWREVWNVFADRYPDQWGVQFFPPASELVDEVNMYHLFVLSQEPRGVNINRRDRDR